MSTQPPQNAPSLMVRPSNKRELLAALSVITSSVTFSRAARLRTLLIYLIEHRIEHGDRSIRGAEIAVNVFARAANALNDASDGIVRVSMNRLRSLLSRYYEAEGAQQTVRFEIPRGSYVPIVRCPMPAELSSCVRIAVLPLADATDEPDGYWMCEGLTGDLIDSLVRVPELHVLAHTSTIRYINSKMDIRDIASALDAEVLIKGVVRKDGARFCLSAELILGRDGTYLWNQAFEADIVDRAALQGAFLDFLTRSLEIHSVQTASVVDALERIRVPSPARALVDQARATLVLSTIDAVRRAESLCLEAIELAPDYAAAWAEIAAIRFRSRALIFSPECASLAGIEDALARALVLDASEPTALSIRGLHRSVHLFDWTGGIADAKRAAALTPNSAINCARYGALCLWAGLNEQAQEMLPHALRLDPLSPLVNYYRVIYAHFEEPDTSVQQLLSVARKRAGDLLVFDELEIGLLVNQGNFKQAYTLARSYRKKQKGAFAIEYRRAQAMAGLGDLTGARALFTKLSRNFNPVNLDYFATGIEVCSDDEDALYIHAQKAIEVRAPHTSWFGLPFFSPKFVGPRGAALFATLRRCAEPPHLPIEMPV